MAPEIGRGFVVVGDAASSVGRLDSRRQCIEKFAEPAFAIQKRRLRAQGVEGDHVGAVAGRTEFQCGYRAIKFVLQKSCFLIHSRVPRT